MKLDFESIYPFWIESDPPQPMIDVRLIGSRGRYADTVALLDTGAEVSLFHAKWAKRIGLPLEAGRRVPVQGIGNEAKNVDGYAHEINLVIGHVPVRCEVVFSEDVSDEPTEQLIGREGVFDAMRFGLRQKVGHLYVGSKP